MKFKRLLIIPARKNSQRIKNKNFINFFGKPIINYSIDLALKSKLFSKIHISTDSIFNGKKIKKKYFIDVDYSRPSYLSNNKVGLLKVFKYVINNYKRKNIIFNEIWFLSSCSPLIKLIDLRKSARIFTDSKYNLMLSICKYSQPIERSFIKKKNKIYPINVKNIKKNSQKFEKKFFHTGSFGAFKLEYFYKNGSDKNILGYEMPPWRSIDVDNNDDLEMTKILFKGQS